LSSDKHFLEDLSDADVPLRYEQPHPGWGGGSGGHRDGLYNIGDIDGDGFSEIAGRQFSQELWGLVVFSTGTGEQLWRQSTFDEQRAVATYFCDSIGDIDGDGVRDIVSESYRYTDVGVDPNESRIIVFSGNDGEILSRKLMASSPRLFGIYRGDASTVDDLNGDGILEIALVDDHAGPGRVGLYSYGPGPTNYLGEDYVPRLGFVQDDDQRFVVWPAVVDSPIVETSTDLQEWEALFDEAPPHNRFPLPEEFESGTRYFRLRYQRPEQ